MSPVIGKKERASEWFITQEERERVWKENQAQKPKIVLRKVDLGGPILKNPRLLYIISQKMEKNGFIGEVKNKLCIFLVGTTKDYEKRHRMGLVIGGESGVGKSWLLRILEIYFEGDVVSISRMSAHAPDYMQDLFKDGTCDGVILLIKQMEGAEQSSYTMMIMVDPVSGGLRLITVEDRKVKERVLKGMPVLVTSSVRVSFDPQINRRFLDIHPDESPEQTAQILMHNARMEEDPVYKLTCEIVDSDIKEIVGKMKYESSKYGVEIPFATLIPSKIPKVILARTDILKIFGMMVTITHLFYENRFHRTNELGTDTLIASPIDYYLAWELIGKTIEKRLGGISDNRINLLLKTLETNDPARKGVSADDLLKAVPRYQKNTIYQAMKELNKQGYVITEKNLEDARKVLYKRTSKILTPIDVTFPDEEIERKYIRFIKEKFGKPDEDTDKKHVLSAEQIDLLKKSLLVCDIESGQNITEKVISEKTFKEYNLGDVSV